MTLCPRVRRLRRTGPVIPVDLSDEAARELGLGAEGVVQGTRAVRANQHSQPFRLCGMNTVQQMLQGDCGDRESEGAILQSLLRHSICQAISLRRSGQVVEDRTVILVRVDMRGKNTIGPGDIWPDFIEGCKGRDSQ